MTRPCLTIREMKEWLFEVRQRSRVVGKLALKAMEDRQRRWRSRSERKGSDVLRVAKVNGPVESVFNERTECQSSGAYVAPSSMLTFFSRSHRQFHGQ